MNKGEPNQITMIRKAHRIAFQKIDDKAEIASPDVSRQPHTPIIIAHTIARNVEGETHRVLEIEIGQDDIKQAYGQSHP